MRSSARTWRAGAKKIQPYAADDFDFLWVHLGVVDLSEHFTRGFFLVPARALRNDTTNRETLVMSVTVEIPPLRSVSTMCDRYRIQKWTRDGYFVKYPDVANGEVDTKAMKTVRDILSGAIEVSDVDTDADEEEKVNEAAAWTRLGLSGEADVRGGDGAAAAGAEKKEDVIVIDADEADVQYSDVIVIDADDDAVDGEGNETVRFSKPSFLGSLLRFLIRA